MVPDAADRVAGPILPNIFPSRVGATVDFRGDYTHFASGSGLSDDLLLIGFNFHGQYIWPQGYGGYVRLPYYYADVGDQSDKGIGNLEVGGLYRVKQGPNSEIMGRVSFAVDSAGQSGGIFAVFANIGPRLYDAYPTGFASNWVTAEGSFHHREGQLRLAAAVGFDFPFGSDNSDGLNINIDGLAKLAVSAGIETPGGIGAGIGYVMLQAIGSDSADDNISGLNATVDFSINPTMKIYGAFGLPDLENNADEFDIWGVGGGIRIAVN